MIGAKHAWGYDLVAACSGFVYALTTGAAMVASGASRRALVVGADVMSSIIDYTDRTTCVLFGDGAGACVVEASDADDIGIIDFENYVDGSGGPALCMPAGGSRLPASKDTIEQRQHYVRQDGQIVFKFAVRNFEEVCRRILDRNGIKPGDIDWFVPHQANSRIIGAAADRLGLANREGDHQSRSVRQHHGGDDSAGLERRARKRPPEARRSRPDGGGGRRVHSRRHPAEVGAEGLAAGMKRGA